jgi:DNA primase
LERRRFNVEHLQRVWGIQSTTYAGFYKHRIFIPVTFEWQTVSFQCLAPTRNPPYLGCKEEKEIIPHKHLVYGFDYAVEKRKCVLVEGVTDVWRLGAGAVGCFGTGWTQEQVNLICNNFDKVIVLLDAEVPQKDKNKLAQNILAHGVWAVDIIDLKKGDPADLSAEQAAEMMADFGF